MRTTGRRIVAAGAVAAGVLWAGTGTAAADPPTGLEDIFPTEGAAYASLPAPDQDLQVFLSVFDGPGGEATAGVEVFGALGPDNYYECFDGPLIPAALNGLEGARAEGRTTLLCGGPNLPRDVVAHVDVDAEWTATGPVDRSAGMVPGSQCVSVNEQRAAEVTGLVTVSIPELGVTASATEGSGDVRTVTSICAGGRR